MKWMHFDFSPYLAFQMLCKLNVQILLAIDSLGEKKGEGTRRRVGGYTAHCFFYKNIHTFIRRVTFIYIRLMQKFLYNGYLQPA